MEKYLAANPQYQVAAPKAAKPAPAPNAAKPAKAHQFKKGDRVRVLWTGRNEPGILTYKDKAGWNYKYLDGAGVERKGTGMKPDQMALDTNAQPWPATAAKPAKPTPAPKAEKQPKAPKAPKAKKVKPVDTRDEVPHLSAEVQYVRPFLRLVGKRVTIEQVRALHRKLEKDITKRNVRIFSHHADLLNGIADTVAGLYDKMTDREIGVIEKLEFTSEDAAALVVKANALVSSQRVGTATMLLSAFINMQGTVPTEKAVANLQKKLSNEYAEHPNGDFALQVGAADAILRDWKPGKVVRITKQQLSGLNGLMALGCPDTPAGKPCGCGPKKARR
jgi:hypothetical protein